MKTYQIYEFKRIKVAEKPVPYRIHSSLDVKKAVEEIAIKEIGSKYKEHCVIFLLDTRLNIIGYNLLSIGTSNACLLDYKDIFRILLVSGADRFILVHNHPTEDITPTDDDWDIYYKLKEIAKLFEIPFDDCLIVNSKEAYSMKEQDFLFQ